MRLVRLLALPLLTAYGNATEAERELTTDPVADHPRGAVADADEI